MARTDRFSFAAITSGLVFAFAILRKRSSSCGVHRFLGSSTMYISPSPSARARRGPREETIKFRLDGFAAHPFSDAVAPSARARLAPILVIEDFLHRHRLRAVLAKARFHFFAFNPSSTRRRKASDRVVSFATAQASTSAINSEGIRA